MVFRVKAETAWAVAGHQEHLEIETQKLRVFRFFHQKIRSNCFGLQEKPELFEEVGIGDQWKTGFMVGDGAAKSPLDLRRVFNVIDMSMGNEQESRCEAAFF